MDPASSSTNASRFAQAEFQAGVTACLRSWSALRTAAEGGWGGSPSDSVAKADDLRSNIYRFMDGSTPTPTIEIEDFEDNLIIYMEEEFSVVLEDSSEKQVSQTLFELYRQCMLGETTLASQLVQAALNYEQQIAAAYPVCVQSTEHDDDDDDDDEMMDTTTTTSAPSSNNTHNMSIVSRQPTAATAAVAPVVPAAGVDPAEYAAQSLFGKTKKPKAPRKPKEEEVQMVDDDGFATVTKGRRKPRP